MSNGHLRLANTADWTRSTLRPTAEAVTCFRGNPDRRALTIGTRIYRLRTRTRVYRPRHVREEHPTKSIGEGILESPWWFPESTYRAIVGGFESLTRDITAASREGLAVPHRFNADFDCLIVFSLRVPGYAYQGPAAPQERETMGAPRLPGGLTQLWIPGLLPDQVQLEEYGSVKL